MKKLLDLIVFQRDTCPSKQFKSIEKKLIKLYINFQQ